MRWLSSLLALILATSIAAVPVDAARDIGPPTATVTPYELVVFEADGCIYCEVFRRDVLPLYSESKAAREAPIRFINLTHADESRMGLSSAITIAPTVVLFRDGTEVDRIIGYTGPFNFVKLVGHMMGKLDGEAED